MRKDISDNIRVFNGKDGEYLGAIEQLSKKSCILRITEKLRDQEASDKLSLAFPIIKKERLNFLIEKSTELGITNFIPIITERSNIAKIKLDKIRLQIIEASEQCERLDIPEIAKEIKLSELLKTQDFDIFACIERQESDKKPEKSSNPLILIGPEGGFSDSEIELLNGSDNITAISLGKNILRSETAAITGINYYQLLLNA